MMTRFIMSAAIQFRSMAALLAAYLLLGVAAAQAAGVPGPLVEVDWLKANVDNVVVLDVRAKSEKFQALGHIPGAVLVPWKEVRGKKTEDGLDLIKMLPSPASFARQMKKSGVSDNSTIVITTEGLLPKDVFFGTRLYWQLKYYGHDNVAILNGGNAAWAEAKETLAKDASHATPGNFSVRAERKELLATTADVQAMVAAGSTNLVDARTLDYYLGLEQKKKYVYAPGHIPGSTVAPNDLMVAHKGPKKFRSVTELTETLRAMGVNTDAGNVAYCNSGHLGSGMWFIMHELVGDKNAKLYDGSMHAWTKDGNNPVNKMQMN